MELNDDVLFEICTRLDPVSLVRFSRSHRSIHELKTLWLVWRRNVQKEFRLCDNYKPEGYSFEKQYGELASLSYTSSELEEAIEIRRFDLVMALHRKVSIPISSVKRFFSLTQRYDDFVIALFEDGQPILDHHLICAIGAGSKKLFDYIVLHGGYRPESLLRIVRSKAPFVGGNPEILAYFLDRQLTTVTRKRLSIAAERGHVELLQWVKERYDMLPLEPTV